MKKLQQNFEVDVHFNIFRNLGQFLELKRKKYNANIQNESGVGARSARVTHFSSVNQLL